MPGSEPLGHRYGKAGAGADAEADNHIIDRTGRSHPRQRLLPQIAAYDDGIHHRVKLLEKIPENQRNGKFQNQLGRGTGRHILCHGMQTSFLFPPVGLMEKGLYPEASLQAAGKAGSRVFCLSLSLKTFFRIAQPDSEFQISAPVFWRFPEFRR